MTKPELPVRRFVPTLTDVVKPGHEPSVPREPPAEPVAYAAHSELASSPSSAARSDHEPEADWAERGVDMGIGPEIPDQPVLTTAQADRVGASVADSVNAVISAVIAHHLKAQQDALTQELTQQLGPLVSVLVSEALEQELKGAHDRAPGTHNSFG